MTDTVLTGTEPVAGLLDRLSKTLRRGEIALALGVVCILVVLILPMPPWLLDFSLAISITLSILILMVALFIQRPLEFSTFPTVLLIATMLRLALNLASTRIILAHGHEGVNAAGHVIAAFGNFVMSGNFIIGVIVFAILVSKAGGAGAPDKPLFGQFAAYPAALGLAWFLMVSLAILPGIPMLPFLALAALTGGAAWHLTANREKADAASAADAKAAAPAPVKDEPINAALQIDQLRLELGYGLLGLINTQKGPRLTDQIKALPPQ